MIGAVLDCKLSCIPRAPRCSINTHTHTDNAGSFFSLAHKWIEGRKRKERKRANREQIAETTAFHWSDREREINGEKEFDTETKRKGSERKRANPTTQLQECLGFHRQPLPLLEKEREDWCFWQQQPLNQTHELQRGETTAGKP